ncbi:hypothetical protein GCM10020220_001220 [Nonomuraea rubra]
MQVVVGRGVEGDVDARAALGDGVGVLLDRGPVGRIERGGLGASPGLGDGVGQVLQRFAGASGQVDGGAFAGEDAGDRGADRSGAAVDDGGLVLQQHDDPFSGAWGR